MSSGALCGTEGACPLEDELPLASIDPLRGKKSVPWGIRTPTTQASPDPLEVLETHRERLEPTLTVTVFRGSDQVAVITALFQLHHDVQEPRGAATRPLGKGLVVSGQDPPAHGGEGV